MHAEVAHAAVGAVEMRPPLPVDRLAGIEVARVQEGGADLEHAPEAALGDPAPGLLAAGVERQLRGDAHELPGPLRDLVRDRLARAQVDPERLLGEQVAAGAQDVEVYLLVQVVRDRAVDGVDRVVGEQRGVVGRACGRRVELLVPGEHALVEVGDVDDPRPHADVGQVHPARDGAGHLAAHQAAADDAQADRAHRRRPASASAGVAPSCTTAISARTIPAGSSCWITLRP
jgi:hypothetical protein